MREIISTITTNNNIEYVVSVKDNYNIKNYLIEDSVCYITRIDKNKFFAKRNATTIQFSYSSTNLDYNKVRKELRKKYRQRHMLFDIDFIYFPNIVDNLITCLKAQSDLVYDLIKDFDKSTWEEKAMIVYQLNDSAEKIRKYEKKQYLLNNPSVLDKVNTLQSITDSLEEL